MSRPEERPGLLVTVRGGLEERLALMAPSRRLRLALSEDAIVSFAGNRPLRVLDAGCGDGLLSLELAKRHRNWQLVGFDFRDDLLSAARHRADDRALDNVAFRQADLTQPLPESGFDVVMALECLTEIPQDREALRTMANALRPGGLFVVQVPDQRWKPILPGSAAVWRNEVRHGYTADALEAMLAEAGLDGIAVRPTFRSTAAVAQEIRDRIKSSPLAVRLALLPLLAAAVRLERRGITWGAAKALLAVARLPDQG
jgi:ubiquinone/menaquinone biosynthesis C-methylase UbiE